MILQYVAVDNEIIFENFNSTSENCVFSFLEF